MSHIDRKPFFRRFQSQDPVGLNQSIDNGYMLLKQARDAGDEISELGALNRLGFELYVIGQETTAVEILETALSLARRLDDRHTEIEVLLSLATARQYLYQHDTAQRIFDEALSLSSEHGIPEFVHFILHHQGRCYVEQGNLPAATRCFEHALRLREQLGDTSRVESTRAALADIGAL